jgi:hypothetical protein
MQPVQAQFLVEIKDSDLISQRVYLKNSRTYSQRLTGPMASKQVHRQHVCQTLIRRTLLQILLGSAESFRAGSGREQGPDYTRLLGVDGLPIEKHAVRRGGKV